MSTGALNKFEVDRLKQATEWFLRLRETPSEEAVVEWMDWCERDPGNLDAYEGVKSVWAASASSPSADEAAEVTPRPGAGHRFARPLAWAAAVMIVIGAALTMRTYFVSRQTAQTLSTPLAMHSDSVLEDGSRLALGGLSKVSTQFSAGRRLIVVESGEAFFHVAKDGKRPFVVQAGPIAVTAIGTAFNVRRGVERIVVTVTEGRVGVASRDRQSVTVDANQQISYSVMEHRLAVAPVDPVLATSWQQGVFKYVREPLADVVADLNRYTPRRIVIEDAALGAERYTGTVFGSRIDDWLEALQSAFPVGKVETKDAIVLTRRDAQLDH